MNTQPTMTLDAWLQGQATEDLLAAEVRPDTKTPTQFMRVIRARPTFESVSRLVIVDALRLPGAERWQAA